MEEKEKDNSHTKVILALLAGAAIGIAIGYLLNSHKKDEIVDDIKESASKLKNNLTDTLDNLKSKLEDHFKDTSI